MLLPTTLAGSVSPWSGRAPRRHAAVPVDPNCAPTPTVLDPVQAGFAHCHDTGPAGAAVGCRDSSPPTTRHGSALRVGRLDTRRRAPPERKAGRPVSTPRKAPSAGVAEYVEYRAHGCRTVPIDYVTPRDAPRTLAGPSVSRGPHTANHADVPAVFMSASGQSNDRHWAVAGLCQRFGDGVVRSSDGVQDSFAE